MKFVVTAIVLQVLIAYSDNVSTYKILGIFPSMSKSHFIVGHALMRGLAEAGHNVTVLSPYPQSKPLKNYRDIDVQGIHQIIKDNIPDLVEFNNMPHHEIFKAIQKMSVYISNFTLTHNVTQQFLNDPTEQFDVIILEVFLNEAMLGLAHHFSAPIIGLSTFCSSKWTNDMVGTPAPPSYVANPLLSYTERMTFFERLGNTIYGIVEHFYFDYVYMPIQEKIYNEIFSNPKPTLSELRTNVSLVLLNTHFSLSFPKPYVPNMIEIGGIQINHKPKPLPIDIQQLLDKSDEHGVIYFSMGSNLRSSNFPSKLVQEILQTFSQLKQNILWKWDDSTLSGIPKNVLIKSWFPQDDILAHKNVRFFITHGGLLSTTESVYHGVPVIGIPVFGDQELNMARAVKDGFGVKISLKELSKETLSKAIDEMLNNDMYKKKVKIISERLRDQPKTPMETGIYWTEYVARHKGAPHMRSAGLDLNWFAYHSIDVYAFICTVILFILYVFKLIISFIVSKLFTTSKKNKVKLN